MIKHVGIRNRNGFTFDLANNDNARPMRKPSIKSMRALFPRDRFLFDMRAHPRFYQVTQ